MFSSINKSRKTFSYCICYRCLSQVSPYYNLSVNFPFQSDIQAETIIFHTLTISEIAIIEMAFTMYILALLIKVLMNDRIHFEKQ